MGHRLTRYFKNMHIFSVLKTWHTQEKWKFKTERKQMWADSSHLIANFIVLCVFTKKEGKDLTKDNK